MYSVLEVCRYVINYSNEKNYGISNLKLQKILYFIQAYFLTFTKEHRPCFGERIEAWDFGPVVPEAYHEYKQYGGGDIPTVRSYFTFVSENFWDGRRVAYNGTSISEEDRERIAGIVDKFAPYTATDLVTLTHDQAPWKDAYEPQLNNEITNEAIRRYFS